MRIWGLIKSVLRAQVVRDVEYGILLTSVWCVVCLWFNPTLYQRFVPYGVEARFPQWAWGTFVAALSTAEWYGLSLRGLDSRRSRRWRRRAIFWLSPYLLSVAVDLATVDPLLMGVGAYAMLGTFGILAYWRLALLGDRDESSAGGY